MPTIALTRHLVIDDGPNLERMTDALKYRKDPSVRIPIKFQVNGDEKLIPVRLTDSIPAKGAGTPLVIIGLVLKDGSTFTGHYDPHTRSGYLDITTR